jgi:transcriptional regulator with XRE-family HTH domain
MARTEKTLEPHQRADLRRLCADGTARALRERAGYSRKDAAGIVGVSPALLHGWETGSTRPTSSEALRRYWLFLAELAQIAGAA